MIGTRGKWQERSLNDKPIEFSFFVLEVKHRKLIFISLQSWFVSEMTKIPGELGEKVSAKIEMTQDSNLILFYVFLARESKHAAFVS
jgi:hypothetical protein